MSRAALAVLVVTATLAWTAAAAAATRECNGLQVCVPLAGPWVVVPTGPGPLRPTVEYQMTCPKGYVVGGLDAELSERAIDLAFLGTLGSPVNPGISTGRSVIFAARAVGASPRTPTFRPHVGCMPSAGGGGRAPTSSTVFRPGVPATRHVRTVRLRPGSQTVVSACSRGERLVAASHALAFFTRRPPDAGLVRSVRGSLAVRGQRVLVTVRADAELAGVRAVVQVHALCSGVS